MNFLGAVNQEVLFIVVAVFAIAVFMVITFIHWVREITSHTTWKKYRLRYIRYIDSVNDPAHQKLLSPACPDKVIMVIPLVSSHRLAVVEASWDFYHDFSYQMGPKLTLSSYLWYFRMKERFWFSGIEFYQYKNK